jgi:hypothetical protein
MEYLMYIAYKSDTSEVTSKLKPRNGTYRLSEDGIKKLSEKVEKNRGTRLPFDQFPGVDRRTASKIWNRSGGVRKTCLTCVFREFTLTLEERDYEPWSPPPNTPLTDGNLLCRPFAPYPKTFKDYPKCLFDNSGLDLTVIVGSSERDTEENGLFDQTQEVTLRLFRENYTFTRSRSWASIVDATCVTSLVAFLCSTRYSPRNKAGTSKEPICIPDLLVSEDLLTKNLIIIGGGDVNVFFPLVTMAIHRQGCILPIHYEMDEHAHFDCNAIVSDISTKTYPGGRCEKGFHCGYLLMFENPWAKNKVVIFASGTHATGTQAALLALTRCDPKLSKGNQFDPTVPAKIVRASKAKLIGDPPDFGAGKEVNIPRSKPIDGRYIITGYEFEE